MAFAVILGSGGHWASQLYPASTTYYGQIGLGRSAISVQNTTEADMENTMQTAGDVSYLSFGTDTEWGSSIAYTLDHNGSATSLQVTIGATVKGLVTDSNPAHAVSVSVGDTLDTSCTTGSGQASAFGGAFYATSALYTPSSIIGQPVSVTAKIEGQSINTSNQAYNNFIGLQDIGTSAEGDHQLYFPFAAKVEWAECYISSNAANMPITVSTRIDGSNGNNIITIGEGQTGPVQNATPASDTLSVGSLLCYGLKAASGNEGSTTFIWMGSTLFPSTDVEATVANSFMGAGGDPTTVISSGVTLYGTLLGGGGVFATENGGLFTRSIHQMPYACSVSEFSTVITAISGTATMYLLQNAAGAGWANTDLTTTTTGTGVVTDSIHSPSFAQGDLAAHSVTTSGGGCTWANNSMLVTQS